MKIIKELLEEMKSVISGKTLDVVLPPILFVVVNGLVGLNIAVIVSLIFAVALGVTRLHRKQAWLYALGGFIGVAIASGFAYLTTNAANFFIPTIISSAFLFLLALLSLFLESPLRLGEAT